ncbi:MAG: FMN-dependent NADH-azoreductase [uncultured Sphingomonas sp.]|uniref:FMN dependent NADH:quinone oxidoreductase n=1 Tax=uncultured Sphingomonas sp. TaxID=158754 RepID=A0A6J4TLA5_9SPHN|nr:NAD(P)H-dependent oxidoreductase [uncultured Sphingomonas sp.]CAA9526315.1 MAG: FMN-dependent NADH-azoreductase [uncultured Sphingomonas sp.]
MTTLLHIDASVRSGERSLSRRLSREFVEALTWEVPNLRVLQRDLGALPPPYVDEEWIAAAFTAADSRTAGMNDALAVSEELIGELEASDVIVVGTPMYNYGMPAPLKAWLDQVVRVGRTFCFDLARGDFAIQPILSGKALVLLTSAGEFGFEPGGVRGAMNHLNPHFATVQGYLGVSSIHHLGVEYQEFGDARHRRSLDVALSSIPKVAAEVASRVRPSRVDAPGAMTFMYGEA